jgi:hypothetical protein
LEEAVGVAAMERKSYLKLVSPPSPTDDETKYENTTVVVAFGKFFSGSTRQLRSIFSSSNSREYDGGIPKGRNSRKKRFKRVYG